jgi:hypothetical protein
MSEFSDAIAEGFQELYGIAGSDWIVQTTGQQFKAVQGNNPASYEVEIGGRFYKNEQNLCCTKADFPNGYPLKLTIVFRKTAPNVKYFITETGSAENDSDPTFTMKLELKIGS